MDDAERKTLADEIRDAINEEIIVDAWDSYSGCIGEMNYVDDAVKRIIGIIESRLK